MQERGDQAVRLATGLPSAELSWHAIGGIRIGKLFKMLADASMTYRQRVYLVVDEIGRALSQYFQRSSEGRLRHGRPFLYDVAQPATSPIVCSLQYLSGLMEFSPGAARLVWQIQGHSSPSAWIDACPDDAALLRRAIVAESAKTQRRRSLTR